MFFHSVFPERFALFFPETFAEDICVVLPGDIHSRGVFSRQNLQTIFRDKASARSERLRFQNKALRADQDRHSFVNTKPLCRDLSSPESLRCPALPLIFSVRSRYDHVTIQHETMRCGRFCVLRHKRRRWFAPFPPVHAGKPHAFIAFPFSAAG